MLRSRLATALAIGLALGPPARARADEAPEAVSHLVSRSVEAASRSLFDFLQDVELFNARGELNRLVGSPWELNEATAYKLSLLPFHIRFPIYRQVVAQMTRQDELRARRVQNATVNVADIIALDLGLLDEGALDYEQRLSAQVRASLGTHFTAEAVDLGFFLLAQRSFFPDSEEGWRSLERRIAADAPALAAGGLVIGSAVDLWALNLAGPLAVGGGVTLGGYAGVRRLGFGFHPETRGGLTLRVPGVELAAGLWRQVRPGAADRRQALELALRAGWLDPQARPDGWDVFFETALREVLGAGALYPGPWTSGRAGLYVKRPWRSHVSLRASAELNSDFDGPARMAVSLGFERERSGLTVVLQASHDRQDTRGGVFVTWTDGPWTQSLVDDLQGRARRVTADWEALAGPNAPGAREELTLRMAAALADYLEVRRRTYRLVYGAPATSDLRGPLDAAVLAEARDRVFARLDELSRELEATPALLEGLRGPAALEAGAAAAARIEAYWRYREAARRIVTVSGTRTRDPDPLRPGVIRRIQALSSR